jgi:putative colanic acid biosynthesis acetyltransferase WcaF
MNSIFRDPTSAGGLDLSKYINRASLGAKLRRFLWGLVQSSLYRWSPKRAFAWRRFLLRMFGAKLEASSYCYPTTMIWDPARLQVGKHTAIGPGVEVYSVDRIEIGSHCTVSMQAFLCTGSHDISDPQMELTHAPIVIENGTWVCARAFIGPGVRLGEGSVVAACAVVSKDVDPWTVVAGNPAIVKKQRQVKPSDS